jgi:hypothetical protein
MQKPSHLLKNILLAVAPLAGASGAAAQIGCPGPVLKVLHDQVQVPAAGSALAPSITLQVQPGPKCPSQAHYTFSRADLTLVRDKRPLLPTLRTEQPQVDLRAFMQASQPGDRIFIEIPYANLVVVAADGKQQPYRHPGRPQPKGTPPADELGGLVFSWLITQK